MAESDGVIELLGVLYNMVKEAYSLPLMGVKCVLDRNKVMDLIEEINAELPTDLEQARKIVESKNDILGSARREADAIKRQADERARQLISQDEITVAARQKANEMISSAETQAREVRVATNQYVDDALMRTEEALNTALGEVRMSRNKFKSASK